MAKKITRIAKLEFEAGKAKPGPELAGLGIIMPKFTKAFNDQTKDRLGEPVPVIITIYNDKSFTFVLKTSPASFMLKKAAGIKSGSANSKTNIVGKITNTQLSEIAKYKLPDLNTNNVELAQKIIAGTAKNMGIIAEGQVDEKTTIQAAKDATKAVATANAKEAKLKAAVKAVIDTKDDEIEVTATAQSNKKEVDK